jgi:hypothetical protein
MTAVMGDVEIIRKSLQDVLASINGIPAALNTGEMAQTVKSAQESLRKIAAERGLPNLGAGGGGGAGGGVGGAAGGGVKGEPGSLNDPKAVESLINQLSETKAMMQATRQLMDEAVNKPVVVDWLEGSK